MPPRATPTPLTLVDRLAGAVWGTFLGAARAPDRGGDGAELSRRGEAALVLLEALAAHGVDPEAWHGAPGAAGAAGLAGLAPLVALRFGHPALMLDVDAFVRVGGADDRTVACACAHARLLEQLLAGRTLAAALARLDAMLDRRTPIGAELGGHLDAARHGGDGAPSPPDEGGPPAAFAAALRAASAEGDGPPTGIPAAGAPDGAAMLVGAWLGARHGGAALLAAAPARLSAHAEVAAGLDRLLARRRSMPTLRAH
jgi:hypothetical protein